jgi:hypothetical protein
MCTYMHPTTNADLVVDPRSLWLAEDTRDASRWERALDDAIHDELARRIPSMRGVAIADLPRTAPAEGPLADLSGWVRAQLQTGLGFVLLRGLQIEAFSAEDLPLAYLALGLPLGTPAPQNLAGELLTHVRDTGADPTRAETRLYTTRAEQDFHTDGADVIGLLCVRTAREGGASHVVSSAALVEEMRRRRPDLHAALFLPFPWHYQEVGQPAFWFERPICTVTHRGERGVRLNTFFIPWYIRRSQELPDAPRLTRVQEEAIGMLETLANDPRFFVSMTFARGDIQWLKNAAILHKRTAYEDHVEPERKRHLMRLWLSAPDFDDGDAQLRRGVVAEGAR